MLLHNYCDDFSVYPCMQMTDCVLHLAELRCVYVRCTYLFTHVSTYSPTQLCVHGAILSACILMSTQAL